jgi:hypothetical protein
VVGGVRSDEGVGKGGGAIFFLNLSFCNGNRLIVAVCAVVHVCVRAYRDEGKTPESAAVLLVLCVFVFVCVCVFGRAIRRQCE